jgi:intein-encoded DNA endonuclease-like protein
MNSEQERDHLKEIHDVYQRELLKKNEELVGKISELEGRNRK